MKLAQPWLWGACLALPLLGCLPKAQPQHQPPNQPLAYPKTQPEFPHVELVAEKPDALCQNLGAVVSSAYSYDPHFHPKTTEDQTQEAIDMALDKAAEQDATHLQLLSVFMTPRTHEKTVVAIGIAYRCTEPHPQASSPSEIPLPLGMPSPLEMPAPIETPEEKP
ncbi:MAG: hypothetical protein FWG75_00685 [Cystobacterineae bacterium]|nr:hypothetical protein [Cystobacterineae bacterium]